MMVEAVEGMVVGTATAKATATEMATATEIVEEMEMEMEMVEETEMVIPEGMLRQMMKRREGAQETAAPATATAMAWPRAM